MVLVTIGTLAQRSIGLFQAQEKYFSAFFFWIGPIPLPAGYTTMGVVAIGLVCHLIFTAHWKRKKAGILITHLGAIMLLFGGFLTAVASKEGNLVVREGETGSYMADHHDTELAVIEPTQGEFDRITTFHQDVLESESQLVSNALPFAIKIKQFCANTLVSRNSASDEIFCRPLNSESNRNISGVLLEIQDEKAGEKQLIRIFENQRAMAKLTFMGKPYYLHLRAHRTYLPFQIHLIDFIKEVHPGTQTPRAFRSVVELIDGPLRQRSVIKMNHPLRHKNYTLYQSSYMEGPVETSVLSVVYNVGRLWPYISSIVMSIGLLVHMLIMVPELIEARRRK
jgi:hypothetical protein